MTYAIDSYIVLAFCFYIVKVIDADSNIYTR